MDEILNRFRNENNCSEEMIQILSNIMIACVNVLGEQYIDRILETFKSFNIYEYENVEEAGKISTQFFNNGKEYRYKTIATGGGITEDEYYLDNNGELKQKYIILISKGEYTESKIQIIIHEICHILSSINAYKLDGNVITAKSGVSSCSFEFNNQMKSPNLLTNENELYNEIITENLAAQIMDAYNPEIAHTPIAYAGYANSILRLFRSNEMNHIFIDDYLNNTTYHYEVFNNIFTNEDIQISLNSFITEEDLKHPLIKDYIEKVRQMSPNEFFNSYRFYLNKFKYPPKHLDWESFKRIKQINKILVSYLGERLNLKKDLQGESL